QRSWSRRSTAGLKASPTLSRCNIPSTTNNQKFRITTTITMSPPVPLRSSFGTNPSSNPSRKSCRLQPQVAAAPETEPTEPGPLDCREEQYPCTRLYSVHKPCKQCLNEICFYSLRRVYVINKEICVRTVCAHEELLR
ncbi:PREDICTED: microfibrillar-associated protein 2, partial [Nestor notabilis]|uniref:microfibrillar-associated protein 2 n=1 Tax=Nestor notabilis TaxID=176057 RepID=UPI0005231944